MKDPCKQPRFTKARKSGTQLQCLTATLNFEYLQDNTYQGRNVDVSGFQFLKEIRTMLYYYLKNIRKRVF
jgi:hypothetical protein